MRLKKCKRCGETYETDRPGTIFCPKCSEEYFKSAPFGDRVCCQCGVTFRGGPRALYCPSCREDRRREAERRYKQKGPARPIGSTDVCKRCGNEYIVESGSQMYCKACADIAIADKVRAHKRDYNAANRDAMNAHKTEMRANRNVCVICGKVFDANTATVTCSADCADKLRKLRQDEADIRRGKRKSAPGVRYDSGLPKSGIVGVTYHRRLNKWQATYKGHYVGVYTDIDSAADALEKYKSAMINDGGGIKWT